MKSTLLCLQIGIVSFLAISPGLVRADEFSIFEEGASTSKADSKSTGKPAEPAPVPMTTEQLKAAVRKEPNRIELIQKLAVQLDSEGQTDKAIKLLWKYIDRIDESHLAKLAEFEFKSKQYDQAVRVATLITGKNPKNSNGWTLLGRAQKQQNLHTEALESFKQAITSNPKNPDPYWDLVKHYEAKNNLYEVRILLQDLIEARGADKETLQKICEINYRDESYEAGIQSCRESLNKDQNSATSSVYLGLCLKATGQKEASISQLRKSAEKFKNSEPAQYYYAEHLQKEKNHIDAVKFFKSAVAADDKSARAWIGLGTASFELQKYEDALVALSKACKLQRFEAATQLRKSVMSLRSNRNLDLLKKYEQAAENCQFQ